MLLKCFMELIRVEVPFFIFFVGGIQEEDMYCLRVERPVKSTLYDMSVESGNSVVVSFI